MHRICIKDQIELVVRYEPTNDYETDFEMEDYLSEAECKKKQDEYVYISNNLVEFERHVKWITDYFVKKFGSEGVDLCEEIKHRLKTVEHNKDTFDNARIRGEQIKDKKLHSPEISKSFCRSLMEYQKESVEHMMTLGNAANFSVPGSGKTTITYAAISRWLEDNTVEKILVIGPTASFLPWEEEYESCFGEKPRSCRISGNIANKFHEIGSSYDLFLIHFNSAMKRKYELQEFMKRWKTVLIIDESHYIKNPDLKQWASTALYVAPFAKHRIVLSGTPMPNNAKDLWTQITFLWPNNFPLGNQTSYNTYAKKHGIGKYQSILDSLFCRIKKGDLELPEPKWHRIKVQLNPRQRKIYNYIAAKTLKEIEELTIHDQAKLQKFRIAKMVRLLQTASNPSLLYEMSPTFDTRSDTFSEEFGLACKTNDLPNIKDMEPSIIKQITEYSKFEIPAKMVTASSLARELAEEGNKVIIWNSFIHNMTIFKNELLPDFDPIMINGQTPKDISKSGNRDELINKFKNDQDSKILIATPASLGESVSLHKNSKGNTVCSHAIYLDRNFNGAQYMQSMDRIHRIGMDKSVKVNYHLIVAHDTIDEVVNYRLNEKWQDMLNALQDDMLRTLDINPKPEIINPNEIDRDYKEIIAHLRRLYQNHESEYL